MSDRAQSGNSALRGDNILMIQRIPNIPQIALAMNCAIATKSADWIACCHEMDGKSGPVPAVWESP
jgi:hypothetical protein